MSNPQLFFFGWSSYAALWFLAFVFADFVCGPPWHLPAVVVLAVIAGLVTTVLQW